MQFSNKKVYRQLCFLAIIRFTLHILLKKYARVLSHHKTFGKKSNEKQIFKKPDAK